MWNIKINKTNYKTKSGLLRIQNWTQLNFLGIVLFTVYLVVVL
jgi:hypothetical protein